MSTVWATNWAILPFSDTKQWRIQGFPEGVRQLQRWGRQPIIFANFPQKLHKIEEIWTEGGARPWRLSLDPPMQNEAILRCS